MGRKDEAAGRKGEFCFVLVLDAWAGVVVKPASSKNSDRGPQASVCALGNGRHKNRNHDAVALW